MSFRTKAGLRRKLGLRVGERIFFRTSTGDYEERIVCPSKKHRDYRDKIKLQHPNLPWIVCFAEEHEILRRSDEEFIANMERRFASEQRRQQKNQDGIQDRR